MSTTLFPTETDMTEPALVNSPSEVSNAVLRNG